MSAEVTLTDAEREALAEVLGDIRVTLARQADWWNDDAEHSLLIEVLRAECVPWAEGLLASDWLAARVEQARADERERIAVEIDTAAWTHDYSADWRDGMEDAARIAREGGPR